MATPVSILSRLQDGNDGDLISTTILNNGTVGTSSGWTWKLSVTPPTLMTVKASALAQTIPGFSLVDGTGNYPAVSTKVIAYHDTEWFKYVTFSRLAGGVPKLSVGYSLRLGNGFDQATFNSFDFFVLEGEAGEFISSNYLDSPAGGFCNHTNSAPKTAYLPAVKNTWYWTTLLWDSAAGFSGMMLYDMSTTPWTLVGTKNSIIALNEKCYSISFGRTDNVGSSIDTDHYYASMAFDLTGETFPLLPTKKVLSPSNRTVSILEPA